MRAPHSATARPLLLGILALVLLATACGDDSADSADSAGEEGSTFQVVTYNAGLARGFVDYAVERTPEVADAISGLDAQLVALQEVWDPEDVEAVVDGAEASFPHAFFLDPQPGLTAQEQAAAEAGGSAGPACPEDEAIPLEDCARQNCDGVPDDQLSDCVLQSCGTEFAGTCPECQTCLAANIGGSLDDILAACAEGSGGGSFAYDGAFGIGILSAEPFLEQDSIVLESSLNRRGVLYVQIDDPLLGTVDVFNTHLSANLDLGESPVPYPGDGSWAEEQAAQIETVNDWIDDHSSEDNVTILLGDMNTSPGGENHTSETPENFEQLVADGWTDAYTDDPGAECTYCNSNLLVGADGGTGPVLDHILVRNFDGEVSVERIFDDPLDIETDDGSVATNLSDHYGLLGTLTPG